SAASEAFLVLGDVYYPGWRVRIDGQPTHIYRTDSVLRGVVVPPGKHVVEFVYRPRSLAHGLAITGVAALLLLGLLVWRRRRTPLALA
ncbi:MAG TPA: YfhO family protein, partial [Gemmataceae bacterium]|nr:YfhO family protein [Gemmataceae bacterium]